MIERGEELLGIRLHELRERDVVADELVRGRPLRLRPDGIVGARVGRDAHASSVAPR